MCGSKSVLVGSDLPWNSLGRGTTHTRICLGLRLTIYEVMPRKPLADDDREPRYRGWFSLNSQKQNKVSFGPMFDSTLSRCLNRVYSTTKVALVKAKKTTTRVYSPFRKKSLNKKGRRKGSKPPHGRQIIRVINILRGSCSSFFSGWKPYPQPFFSPFQTNVLNKNKTKTNNNNNSKQ